MGEVLLFSGQLDANVVALDMKTGKLLWEHPIEPLRSPQRPNPLGTSIVKLVGVEGNTVLVRGLDCLDETPLVDLKPDRCEFSPLAQPQAGDFEEE